jgi:hypothetical protein
MGCVFMDIASYSMDMKQASLQNSVQISVMKIAMNDNQLINNEMTQIMNNMAIDENLGNNLDVKV